MTIQNSTDQFNILKFNELNELEYIEDFKNVFLS